MENSGIQEQLSKHDELAALMYSYRLRVAARVATPGAVRAASTVAPLAGAVQVRQQNAPPQASGPCGLIDIGANILDPMFRGEYREKPRHQSDLTAVLSRAKQAGVEKIMVTAGSLQDVQAAADFVTRPAEGDWPQLCCTVGVHPTNCNEFAANPAGAAAHIQQLLEIGRGCGKSCVAVGELGLDYDRFNFCDKETQLTYFEMQLTDLAAPMGLPLFLHCRTGEAAEDLRLILRRHRALLPTPPGVVHSFDGALEDALGFIELGFFIGINGCSLRTAENLEVVKQLPADSILLETDAPWCGIKATHAGYGFVKSVWDEVKKPEKWEDGKLVKDRCEPCHLRRVLEVVAGCRGTDEGSFAKQVYKNTRRVFFPDH